MKSLLSPVNALPLGCTSCMGKSKSAVGIAGGTEHICSIWKEKVNRQSTYTIISPEYACNFVMTECGIKVLQIIAEITCHWDQKRRAQRLELEKTFPVRTNLATKYYLIANVLCFKRSILALSGTRLGLTLITVPYLYHRIPRTFFTPSRCVAST
jgi:hypothetical protein